VNYLIFSLSVLFSATVFAESGGYVTTQVGRNKDNAYAVTLDAEGRILTAGASHNGIDSDICVTRFLPTGELDLSFGHGGAAIYDSRFGEDKAYAIAQDVRGRILIAGAIANARDTDLALIRLRDNGTLDTTFGKGGIATYDFGKGNDTAYAMTLQPDGKWLVVGSASNGKDLDFALWRVDSDGKIDKDFGKEGVVITGLGDSLNRVGDEYGYSVALQAPGRILVTGFSELETSSVFVTLRYFSNGRLDMTYGQHGTVVTHIGRKKDKAYASVEQADGKLLIAGTTQTETGGALALARYTRDGAPDMDFGQGGVVQSNLGGEVGTIYGLQVQPDGKIIAAGTSSDGKDTDLLVVRFLANGEIDSKFGALGKAGVVGQKGYAAAYALTLQSDGKPVVAGVIPYGNDFRVSVARFLPEGKVDPDFGTGALRHQVAGLRAKRSISAEMGLPRFIPLPTTGPRP